MIEKSQSINSNYAFGNPQIRKSLLYNADKGVKVSPSTPKDVYESSGTSKSESYVILPPKDLANAEKGAIYKAVERDFKKFNVTVNDRLPLIGGFVANLDDKTKEKLVKAGYYVFQDEYRSWIPTPPDQKMDTAESIDTFTDVKTEKLEERPKLKAPRFDTPLTRKYTGKGVTIAIIDTGIYPHPDFTYPENRILAFVDFVNGKKIPYDDNGHGTHVAGDAVGSGKMSGGVYKGLAPEANIVALKALAGSGGGRTSNIIKAITWCIQNKDKYNIRVINMSLGHPARKDFENDPVNQAVKKAYEAGIVVVAAAGNEGPDPRTIGTPGDSPYALTVGAADDRNTKDPSDDKITNFSSRGPTPGGLIKPDVVAPGEAIIAPMSPGTEAEEHARKYTYLHRTMKWFYSMPDEMLVRVPTESLKMLGLSDATIERWHSSPEQARKEIRRIFSATERRPIELEAYVGMPGTSMASPIAAGMVLEMIQANPDLTPDDVFNIVKMTADKLPGDLPATEQGHGMIDPDESIRKALELKEGKLKLPPYKPETLKQEGVDRK